MERQQIGQTPQQGPYAAAKLDFAGGEDRLVAVRCGDRHISRQGRIEKGASDHSFTRTAIRTHPPSLAAPSTPRSECRVLAHGTSDQQHHQDSAFPSELAPQVQRSGHTGKLESSNLELLFHPVDLLMR